MEQGSTEIPWQGISVSARTTEKFSQMGHLQCFWAPASSLQNSTASEYGGSADVINSCWLLLFVPFIKEDKMP